MLCFFNHYRLESMLWVNNFSLHAYMIFMAVFTMYQHPWYLGFYIPAPPFQCNLYLDKCTIRTSVHLHAWYLRTNSVQICSFLLIPSYMLLVNLESGQVPALHWDFFLTSLHSITVRWLKFANLIRHQIWFDFNIEISIGKAFNYVKDIVQYNLLLLVRPQFLWHHFNFLFVCLCPIAGLCKFMLTYLIILILFAKNRCWYRGWVPWFEIGFWNWCWMWNWCRLWIWCRSRSCIRWEPKIHKCGKAISSWSFRGKTPASVIFLFTSVDLCFGICYLLPCLADNLL